ncbi:MAG TPA: permease prefix domain 1-containing protein, partial [Thermoanaerobaculia bacterium]
MTGTALRAFGIVRLRLRSVLLRPRVEDELAAEMSFHLEQQIAENMSAGMGAREARQAALRAFGGLLQIEERCREMRGTQRIEEIGRDLTFAWRTFSKSPAFTLVAVLSLALGIGANTAIFSLVNALLLRQLPVVEPARLVALGDPSRTGGQSEGTLRNDLVSAPLYAQFRTQSQSYTDLYASGRSGRITLG